MLVLKSEFFIPDLINRHTSVALRLSLNESGAIKIFIVSVWFVLIIIFYQFFNFKLIAKPPPGAKTNVFIIVLSIMVSCILTLVGLSFQ